MAANLLTLSITVLSYGLAIVSICAGLLLFYRVRSLRGITLWLPKALAGSAAYFTTAMGLLGALLGIRISAPFPVAVGLIGSLLSLRYLLRVARSHSGFELAFGSEWFQQIQDEQSTKLLKRRWRVRSPGRRSLCPERHLTFWKLPDTDQKLYCDIWQPPEGAKRSGLALVYYHGGAWHFMDKDLNTRPFFRHLISQGHVVMDVAYRMSPDVDIFEMLNDAKRAIAWMKEHHQEYGIDPGRVVVVGGSAGAQLAMLAAYTPNDPQLTPTDLEGIDTSVRAVISYYGPTDMSALYEHFVNTFEDFLSGGKPRESEMLLRFLTKITDWATGRGDRIASSGVQVSNFDDMMVNMFGGTPAQVPELYAKASPLEYAGPHSPPTLLLYGRHDCFIPPEMPQALHHKLSESGAPSVYVEFPQTEHAFDLVMPRYAPAAQAALHDVDRFLALLV